MGFVRDVGDCEESGGREGVKLFNEMVILYTFVLTIFNCKSIASSMFYNAMSKYTKSRIAICHGYGEIGRTLVFITFTCLSFS